MMSKKPKINVTITNTLVNESDTYYLGTPLDKHLNLHHMSKTPTKYVPSDVNPLTAETIYRLVRTAHLFGHGR